MTDRAELVDDLAMIAGRLAHSLKNVNKNSAQAAGALDYLKRHNLLPSPMRNDEPPTECPECFGKGAITMSDGVSSHPCTLCEAKPLPESDEQWIERNVFFVDAGSTGVLPVYDVHTRLKELHNQHQAELAAKDAEIVELKDLCREYMQAIQSHIDTQEKT